MTPSTGSSVFPTCVALAPLEGEPPELMGELRKVADALQTQVTRDLRDVWRVCAKVEAYPTLERVPPGYIPLTVTPRTLPLNRKGFHFTLNGLPFAVVEYLDELRWSLAASHELIEMLCDPYGQRAVLAPPLPSADEGANEPVNYIVEVCDPCEYSTYWIDDVVVSDFVTPAYYPVGESSDGPYSFLGHIEKPLEILQGGAISWRRYPPSGLIHQAYSDTNEADEDSLREQAYATKGKELNPRPASNVKTRVVAGAARLPIAAQGRLRGAAADAPRVPDPPQYEKGKPQATLRADIEALLAWLEFLATTPQPDLSGFIEVLTEMLQGPAQSEASNAEPEAQRRSVEERLNVSLNPEDTSGGISIETLGQVLDYLKTQKAADDQFGRSGVPLLGLWMAVQIG